MQSFSTTKSYKEKESFKKFKIIHVAGTNDQLKTGIADYAYRLAQEQKAHNIAAIFLSSQEISKEEFSSNILSSVESKYEDTIDENIIQQITWEEFAPNKGKGGSEEEQKENDLKKQKTWRDNEETLEGLKRELEEKDTLIIWHFHFAVGHCGDIVSPEWLKTQRAVATIHEYKTGKDEKSLRKRLLTEKYINAVNGHIIANEATFEEIKKHNICLAKYATSCAVPPNIDTTSAMEEEFNDKAYDYLIRENRTVHFGMMREGKGIEDVIEAQKEVDHKKSEELAESITIIVGAVPKDRFDYYRGIVRLVFSEQTLSSENLKQLGITDPEIFETPLKDSKQDIDALVSTVRALEYEYAHKANTALKVVKNVNVCLVPNADTPDVRKIVSESRRAYLPFDRGATPHSGSLPACINFRTAIITKEGKETPEEYKKVMMFANTPQEAAAWYQTLEKNPTLYKFYSNAAKKKIKVVSFTDVAQLAQLLYNAVASEYKETKKELSTSEIFSEEKTSSRSSSKAKFRKQTTLEVTPSIETLEKEISDEEMAYSAFGQGSFTAKFLRDKQQRSIQKNYQYS